MFIKENLSTPVKYECDVLVCGGGVAGIAAACAAARSGKSVMLVERGFMLGGLATAGLVTIYLPLCDGYGKQVSFGLAEELLRLSISVDCDGQRGYANWVASDDPSGRNEKSPRFEVNFNPQLFALSAERLLKDEGVKLLYGTYAVGAVKDGLKIKAVIFENKSGRFAVAAKSVVDCTGDADIAHFSGAPTRLHEKGNVLASWYYFYGKDGYGLNMFGAADIPDEMKEKDFKLLDNRRFNGVDGDDVSDFTEMSHERALTDVLQKRQSDPKFVPTTLPTLPQFRMTRKLVGEYCLSENENGKTFFDSVGMVSDWRRRGFVYQVPFRTLYNANAVNLLCAGRCTSVTDGMWDIMRVIPCCAVTGEAVGVAAAMTDDMTALSVEELQRELKRRGVAIS